jgi:predicted dehydrogenase
VGSDIGAKAFHNFRKVLDRKDVNAVVISTPDHWHALPAILACQTGERAFLTWMP